MDHAPEGVDLWRLTLQHSPIGVALVGLDGKLLLVNRSLCELMGYQPEELEQLSVDVLTHPDDRDANRDVLDEAVASGVDSYRVRRRYIHADGHLVPCDVSVALVRDQDGQPLYLVSQLLDISEQEEAERRMQAANAELEAIFDTVNVGLLLIDSEGRYARMNPRHEETLALPFPDGHGGEAGQLGEVYTLDGRRMTRDEMPSTRAARGEEFDDYTYWAGDDTHRRAFSTSARQVRGPAGEFQGAALAYQDVTDLISAMRVKDEFVSSVSHELRTPLTTVLGYLEMLADRDDLPPDVAHQIGIAERNAQRLLGLVTDVLHVARAGAGHLVVNRVRTDLAAVVNESTESVRPLMARSGLTMSVRIEGRPICDVDDQRICQVIDNLVSNAAKYTPAGGSVEIRLRNDGDWAELEVADTGMGIPPDELAHIFDPFFRGGRVLAEQISGTGLGLNVVTSILAAHGGEISAESVVGEGSTFRVRLPRSG